MMTEQKNLQSLQGQEVKGKSMLSNKENILQENIDLQNDKNISKEVILEEAPKDKDISSLVFSEFDSNSALQENFKKFRKERNEKCKNHQTLRNKKDSTTMRRHWYPIDSARIS